MRLSVFILAAWLALIFSGCGSGSSQEKQLLIFHAGSVSQPILKVSDAFMKQHPSVKILHESAGSVESARKITELQRICDVFISADIFVIEKMLWPRFTNRWYGFASNAMGIAFTPQSRYAITINENNWYEILLRDDVIFARADPQADPCGYRTLFVWQLAEKFYNKPGMNNKLLRKDNNFIRPKESDLLMLLQTHNVDYIFLYRSLALQHGLRFLELPDSINLSKPELQFFYQSASIQLRGRSPQDIMELRGSSILYGVTQPLNAPHPDLAQEYLRFLLDKTKGQRIFEAAGHSLPDTIFVYPPKYH